MTSARSVFVEGIAFWAPLLPGWPVASAVLRGDAPAPVNPAARPDATQLPPTERRRVPDTVAIALEVAGRACAAANVDPALVPSVFACTHGDLAINDYLCATLASSPLLTSPTKFHNSVHNAPAGYWSIATGSNAPSISLAASKHTFGAGFLEVATQVMDAGMPVLYVAYDIGARGPLAKLFGTRGMLATGLVLAARASARSVAEIVWHLEPATHPEPTPARIEHAGLVEPNAMASCLALFEALAGSAPSTVLQTLGDSLALRLAVRPCTIPGIGHGGAGPGQQ